MSKVTNWKSNLPFLGLLLVVIAAYVWWSEQSFKESQERECMYSQQPCVRE